MEWDRASQGVVGGKVAGRETQEEEWNKGGRKPVSNGGMEQRTE